MGAFVFGELIVGQGDFEENDAGGDVQVVDAIDDVVGVGGLAEEQSLQILKHGVESFR